jgi:aspartate ammonia-lyase
MVTRTESDFIGSIDIPAEALYGIHASRARENFPDKSQFPVEWYQAVGLVKKACYLTYQSFKSAASEKFPSKQLSSQFIDDEVISFLIESADEIAAGGHFENFIVPGISGGAGTSINMNINEIIANAALLKMGMKPGDYHKIDPIEHANVFQSTNDVIPSALKVSLMFLLKDLESGINVLRAKIEELEGKHRNDLRIGFTQMQEAIPSSFGKLLGAYSEALSRDWWRVSKCFERLKMVNLGGGAIGTGLAIPRFVIMEAANNLQKITGLPIARSENLPDATSNLDSLVEVHAIMKSHAVNLEKMVSDIRLLASDLLGKKEIEIPQKQAGSSIMPGKINPVIPEFVISSAHRVYSNDQLITSLCALGCLELNAYLPVIGVAMIESIKLLIASDKTLRENLFEGMNFNADAGMEKLFHSPSITTALIPFIGYNKAGELAKLMRTKGISIFEANEELAMITEEILQTLLKPENLLKLGYTLNEQLE